MVEHLRGRGLPQNRRELEEHQVIYSGLCYIKSHHIHKYSSTAFMTVNRLIPSLVEFLFCQTSNFCGSHDVYRSIIVQITKFEQPTEKIRD